MLSQAPNSSKVSCPLSKNDEVEVWYKRLRHLNLCSIQKSIFEEAKLGIPPLHAEVDSFCGECQIGKQRIKASHKRVSNCNANRVLEQLCMDLMESMQVESLCGKRYVFIYVDDFPKFTWFRFIKKKFDTPKICRTLCL